VSTHPTSSTTPGEPQLRVTISPTRTGAHVTLAGDLDVATGPRLGRLPDRLHSSGHHIELDLAAVAFCDARGLAALLEARHRLDAAGHRVELTRVPARVDRVLAITGLTWLTHQDATATR
jgi:anti-sigma B factor antagonist